MAMSISNIKPCAFCGSTDIRLDPMTSVWNCHHCFAGGPAEDTINAVLWNSRETEPTSLIHTLEKENAKLRWMIEEVYAEGWIDSMIFDHLSDAARDPKSDWEKSDTFKFLYPGSIEEEAGS